MDMKKDAEKCIYKSTIHMQGKTNSTYYLWISGFSAPDMAILIGDDN